LVGRIKIQSVIVEGLKIVVSLRADLNLG